MTELSADGNAVCRTLQTLIENTRSLNVQFAKDGSNEVRVIQATFKVGEGTNPAMQEKVTSIIMEFSKLCEEGLNNGT